MTIMDSLRPEERRYLEAALRACGRAGNLIRASWRAPGITVEAKADGSPVTSVDREAEAVIREVLRTATPEIGVLGEEFGAEDSTRDRWIVDPVDGTENLVSRLPYFATLLALELAGEITLGVVHSPLFDPVSETGTAAGTTWWALRGHGAFRCSGTEEAAGVRLAASGTRDLAQAFVVHGGLVHFQQEGLWDGLTKLAAQARRTRGFGDWWGHVLVAEGRCDAMVDPQVVYHDVAALAVLVEEAGGRVLTRDGAPLGPTFKGPFLSSAPALAAPLAGLLGL